MRVREEVRILLGRFKIKRSGNGLLLTGLRGVNKTVLANEIGRLAQTRGYRTIVVDTHEGTPLPVLLAPLLRRRLLNLERIAAASDNVRRALAVLKSFVGAVKVKNRRCRYRH